MTQLDGTCTHGTADEGKTVGGSQPAPPLEVILAALPENTMLTAGWVLARLTSGGASGGGTRDGTVSAQEFGDLRVPRRSADWVRDRCAEGRIEGAYKDGGEWRIPRAALTQPIQQQAPRESVVPTIERSSRRAKSGAPAFPRWRQD